MPNDLTFDLIGTPVVGFGSTWTALQRVGAGLTIRLSNLKVALLAEAELTRRFDRSESFAFALNQHGQFTGNFVILLDRHRCASV